jgi:chromosomal replication initiation ATPase DnaA
VRDATPADLIAALGDRGVLDLVERVARVHGVTVEQLVGRGRTREVTAARHEAWAALIEQLRMSQNEAALLFRRDSTTISAAMAAVARRRTASPRCPEATAR